MDKSTQQNAAMVEETSAATRNLSSEVRSLAERAAVFKFERRNRNVAVANDRRKSKAPSVAAPNDLPIRKPIVQPRSGRAANLAAVATADWAEF